MRPAAARRLPWLVALVGGVGFVVLAAVLVPWQPVPGGMPAAVPAGTAHAAELARAEDYAGTTRLIAWASLAVSLAVSCLLGFTSLGTRLLGRRPPWPVTVIGLVTVVLLIGRLATLPFGWALQRRRVDYGLSTQSDAAWLLDQLGGSGWRSSAPPSPCWCWSVRAAGGRGGR